MNYKKNIKDKLIYPLLYASIYKSYSYNRSVGEIKIDMDLYERVMEIRRNEIT